MFPIHDENERGRGPAFVSLAFIAINVAVFVLLQGAGATLEGFEFTYGFSAVPYEITNGVDLTTAETITVDGQPVEVPQYPGPSPIWLTLITSMFMHGGWLHLGGNMNWYRNTEVFTAISSHVSTGVVRVGLRSRRGITRAT